MDSPLNSRDFLFLFILLVFIALVYWRLRTDFVSHAEVYSVFHRLQNNLREMSDTLKSLKSNLDEFNEFPADKASISTVQSPAISSEDDGYANQQAPPDDHPDQEVLT